jgi:hypothetical protein
MLTQGENDGAGLAGVDTQDAPNLLQIEAGGLGGAQEDCGGDDGHVSTLGDDFAGGQHLKPALPQIGNALGAGLVVEGASILAA